MIKLLKNYFNNSQNTSSDEVWYTLFVLAWNIPVY